MAWPLAVALAALLFHAIVCAPLIAESIVAKAEFSETRRFGNDIVVSNTGMRVCAGVLIASDNLRKLRSLNIVCWLVPLLRFSGLDKLHRSVVRGWASRKLSKFIAVVKGKFYGHFQMLGGCFAQIRNLHSEHWGEHFVRRWVDINKPLLIDGQPRSHRSDSSVGRFLNLTGLVQSGAGIDGQNDEGGNFNRESWFLKLSLEFLIETVLFGIGGIFMAFGWWLVGWNHESVSQVVFGLILMAMAQAIFFVFVLIFVGEILF